MSEHVDVSKIKDPTIAAARKEVEFQRAMNPCPIDFSEFQSSNPRSQGEQKGMKVKMHRILTVVKNILIVKSLNSQHLLAVNQGFYL